MKDFSYPSRRDAIIGLGALAGGTAWPTFAFAADGDWPTRPVKIIVANPPGQAVDIVGRLFAEFFSRTFGQQFIVDNRPGAGGLTATAFGSHLPPDGYTLIVSSSGPLVVTPAIKKGMPYDSLKDFTHICNIALTPQVLIVGAGSPFRTAKDVVEAARAKPAQLNYATSGVGSTSHLGMEAFCSAVGVKMTHIPYKGNQEALTQLISGDVALGSDTVPGALAMIKAGKLRALGIAAPDRSPYLPDVPTLAEQGYKVEALGWIGLSAPAGLPRPMVDKLNRAIQAALATPEFKEKFISLALISIAGTPEQFEGFVRSELGKWSAVAKAANVQVE